MRLGRARILASIAAIATAAGALAASAISSASAAIGAPVALTASAATPLPAHAVRLGALPEASKLSVDVELKLGNEAGLDALVNGLADPKSPFFHDFVAKGEFGPEFGLSLTAIAQVSGALRSLGLDPGPADGDRLYIPVTGTASAIDRAFGITLVNYRLADGRVAYANSAAPKVPASIASYVGGVLGLDNVYLAGPLDHLLAPAAGIPGLVAQPLKSAARGPQACISAAATAAGFGGYTATQLAAHYAMSTLYSLGDLGQGIRVAVAELQPNLPGDIAGFESCYGIHTPVKYITVDASVGTGPGTSESALDIEDIASIAPDVTIDDYQDGSTTVDPIYDIAAKVADQDRDQVLSISYGLCEAEAGPATLAAYQTVFKVLNSEGITTVASAGDYGPTGCYTGTEPSATLSPFTPASTAYVLSVGGTTMTSAAPLSTETAWNGTGTANPGAGGGGVSSLLCMPAYQDPNQRGNGPPITGVISVHSAKSKSCDSPSDPKGYRREVPDVSANASGSSPYVIYFDGKWNGVYGTSASAPLVGAEAALIDASPYCSSKGWNSGKRVGMLPQALYSIVSANNSFIYTNSHPYVLYDVTTGNTDDIASGYTGGLYPATKGYDEATGLGTPLLTAADPVPTYDPGMAVLMCNWYAAKGLGTIRNSSISPAIGRAGKATSVTLKGTGFLEIPDTDLTEVNTKNNTKTLDYAWASCSSHTTCKAILPALKAGTYQIETLVTDFPPCPGGGCKAYVTFKVYAAPTITKVSPGSGGPGTRVTIRGTSFAGVKGVYFGSKKGVGAKVISSTEITVTVPAGSGTVEVKVAAVGGTSNTVSFRY
jgi:subtilase family serine protease